MVENLRVFLHVGFFCFLPLVVLSGKRVFQRWLLQRLAPEGLHMLAEYVVEDGSCS